jgi:hypothetical protein
MTASLGRAEDQVREVVDLQVTALGGHPPRASRFLREVERSFPEPRRR